MRRTKLGVGGSVRLRDVLRRTSLCASGKVQPRGSDGEETRGGSGRTCDLRGGQP